MSSYFLKMLLEPIAELRVVLDTSDIPPNHSLRLFFRACASRSHWQDVLFAKAHGNPGTKVVALGRSPVRATRQEPEASEV